MPDGPNIDTDHVGDEIEIPLPGGVPSTTPSQSPRQHKIELLKTWANVIATAAALITAVAAAVKPNDPVNKASYEELKTVIEQIQKNDVQNHEDIMALRTYLDGYYKGTGIPIVLPPVGPLSAASAAPVSSTAQIVLVKPSPSSSAVVAVATSSPPPPLPNLHSKPPEQKLPNYDDLKVK